MKCSTKRIPPVFANAASGLWQKRKILSFILFLFWFGMPAFSQNAPITISGIVQDSTGAALANTTVIEKGKKSATVTDAQGKYTIKVTNGQAILVFSTVGYSTRQVKVENNTTLNISLSAVRNDMDEVIVVGYGTKKKESITGAVSSISAKDLDRVHGGSTVSSGLAGKIPGVTFRMPDGRPGSGASIQIRNMGAALYVIDGIQSDEAQFNNLAPNDVESISVLKDASAAIYGVRAANGVIFITTKQGRTNTPTRVNLDAYTGGQNWTRFPTSTNSAYDYKRFRAEAELNSFGNTTITQAELDKYKLGTDPDYRSFDWKKFIIKPNAPQTSLNANLTGGSDKVNYYISGTNLKQISVLGREYWFERTNIQSNVTAQVTKRLKIGVQINGRQETHQNPGVPGGDDYFLARLALLTNTPLDRPYANDNPAYLKDNGDHTQSNWAFLNYKLSGKYRSDLRVLQTNISADYQIPGIKGLTLRGVYSYHIDDYLENNQEYTYNAYTYRAATNTYDRTNGSTNPWRDREQIKQINTTVQAQLNYNNKFGDHTIGATFVSERINTERTRNWIHASPTSNALPLIYFPTMDQYQDSDDKTARVGYVGRINYNYANKYYLEASGRRDASYLFPPDHRIGYFPNVSVGWRITQEAFMKNLLGSKPILTELKLRGSYGILGDDRNYNDPSQPLIRPFGYLGGYNYNVGSAVFGGTSVVGSQDVGVPITNLTWYKSKMSDVGMDFALFNSHLSGTVDYFYRKRTGLLGVKNDVILPTEIGYGLPAENLGSDAQYGTEFSLSYVGKIGEKFNYNIGGNFSISRGKNLDSYKPRFNNSLDQYRFSSEQRLKNIDWGYVVIGQFTSQEQINNYKVDIDGQGNKTLLPGDLIYKDQNGDGKIDGNDDRPISYGYGQQPNINFGFTVGFNYNSFDFHMDMSGAAGYTWYQNWEQRWAFQNNGNLNTIFEDRWHHADPLNVSSPWVAGKYPPTRFNPGFGHSDYNHNSTFWLHNVSYLRMRTIELGYSLPQRLLAKIKLPGLRFYVNGYNMLTFDNLKKYGVDPEVIDDNGLQFPQNKFVNVGIHVAL